MVFENGKVYAVIGANGSGKSNISDAVRWVLGEQSAKQLRGASMQDVIFAGTEMRKPQGFAYVAITLDNSDHQLAIDFDEVTVSRRIYRSGESEYMLNGSPCRLKDINELFYDTGIGKEGYSIIGQGQIDKILSGRPEDRRELFDEAAGIVKFKRRKNIAQKKLEDEKQNLIRVSDILSELEKQVGPLEKQAAAAKEYLRLRDELKHYDVNLFLAENEIIQKNLAEIREKEAVVSGDMEDSRKESEQIKLEYDKLSDEIYALDSLISEKQNASNEAFLQAGNLEGRIGILNEQIRAEEMNAEHIRQRVMTIEAEINEKDDSRRRYQAERDALSGEVDVMKAALLKAETALTDAAILVDELEQSIEEEKSALIEALNDKSKLSVKKQRFDTMLEQIQIRKSELNQRLLTIQSESVNREETLKNYAE